MQLPLDIDSVRGFLDPLEGEALLQCALEVAGLGPALEVGSYCGKSTVYLGCGCQQRNSVLYAVDHHRGSEEHQPGEEYHDPRLLDERSGLMDSFFEFRSTIARAGLEDVVVPVVAPSRVAARGWATPLSLVFVDGGHSRAAAQNDLRAWAGHIVAGGYLLIHDLFDDPATGGQAPIEIYRQALASGLFAECPRVATLGILRRLAPE